MFDKMTLAISWPTNLRDTANNASLKQLKEKLLNSDYATSYLFPFMKV
jgi:hypothetical protein